MKPGEVYRDECRHFNGIQHDCCRAGVRYKDVELHAEEHPRVRLPCKESAFAGVDVRVPDTCPKRSFLTQEEHAARTLEMNEAVNQMLTLTAAGKCHVCKVDIEPTKIVGRCKYAACGHRIGQVSSR